MRSGEDTSRRLGNADLELVADAIARATPQDTDAIEMQVTADVVPKGPRRQRMPAGRPQRIAPEALRAMHARWAEGDRTGAARALLDAWISAYWPGMLADFIANIVWVEVKAIDRFRLTLDLVPGPLFGQSLANRLRRPDWLRLRAKILRRNGSVCEVCGASGPLECDEVWDYDDEARVARLTRLRIVCRTCHEAKHFGRTRSLCDEQEVEAVIAHFCSVNGCDRAAFESHEKRASDLWWERSQPERGKWTIDFGEYTSLVRAASP